jgi:hypothetical protein
MTSQELPERGKTPAELLESEERGPEALEAKSRPANAIPQWKTEDQESEEEEKELDPSPEIANYGEKPA